jgi:hypothetical protein
MASGRGAVQSVVLAFEDLQWADPTSLDLLRAVADRGAQARLLLLATTRPEFRPLWSLRSHHSLISLSPLDPAGVARIVSEISARHALSKDVVKGVNERTGGLPLFVEEVTRLAPGTRRTGRHSGDPADPTAVSGRTPRQVGNRGNRARDCANRCDAWTGLRLHTVRDIAEVDEPGLQTSLDRVTDAALLFVEGAPPEANYRYKHATQSHVIWAKDRTGTGYWFRNKHELLLVGTRREDPAPAPGTQWHR